MSFRLLDAWVDAGMNFVDTADVYSRWVPGHAGGESETIIGKWLRQSGKRNRVVLATKVGKPMGDDDKGLSTAYIRRAVEASLRRLKTDVIDLYQSHDDDADDAARGDAGDLRRADQGRQGARDRRLELQRAAPGARARDEPSASACRATSRCSRSTTWSSASRTRASSSRSASSTASASSTSTRWRAAF